MAPVLIANNMAMWLDFVPMDRDNQEGEETKEVEDREAEVLRKNSLEERRDDIVFECL